MRVGWDREKNGYAMGELIAEMASCFLADRIGCAQHRSRSKTTPPTSRVGSAAMKDDTNYIFKASRQASKVCDFLLSFVKQDETEPKPELVEAA